MNTNKLAKLCSSSTSSQVCFYNTALWPVYVSIKEVASLEGQLLSSQSKQFKKVNFTKCNFQDFGNKTKDSF